MVVNDRIAVDAALKAIVENPDPENVSLLRKVLPDQDYGAAVTECFMESDFVYAGSVQGFHAAVGVKVTSSIDCLVWFTHTEGADKYARFLLRNGRGFFSWMTEKFSPLCMIGNSYIHKEFLGARRLIERFGFSKVMLVGDIVVYSYVFGEY